MLLAIDIGNTHTVIGVFKEHKLLTHWRVTSDLARTEDEIVVLLNFLLEEHGLNKTSLKGAAISSVVPDLTPIYKIMCKKYFQFDPLIISASVKLNFDIKYKNPSAVGADRICNAASAIEKYGTPLIIIDFGTATTFDCIDKNGDYLGGIIAPGINTSVEALHKRAAKLPSVDIDFPEQIIGRTTDESIQSGIMIGTCVMIEGMICRLKDELGSETKTIATGGLAKKIARNTECINEVNPYLSLEGIASIYSKNK
jgi:type III pantothenate kinase